MHAFAALEESFVDLSEIVHLCTSHGVELEQFAAEDLRARREQDALLRRNHLKRICASNMHKFAYSGAHVSAYVSRALTHAWVQVTCPSP